MMGKKNGLGYKYTPEELEKMRKTHIGKFGKKSAVWKGGEYWYEFKN